VFDYQRIEQELDQWMSQPPLRPGKIAWIVMLMMAVGGVLGILAFTVSAVLLVQLLFAVGAVVLYAVSIYTICRVLPASVRE
jgi:hypothetical protein